MKTTEVARPGTAAEFDRLMLAAPPMTGAEYLNAEVLASFWQELDAAFGTELAESKCGIEDFLKRRDRLMPWPGLSLIAVARKRASRSFRRLSVASPTFRKSATVST